MRVCVNNSRKQNTRTFQLSNLRVCKAVFLKTLAISNHRLDYCLNLKSKDGMCSPDKRGKHSSNKTSEVKINRIRNFLEKFPKYKSHYSNSEKIYFSPHLSKQKLYELYEKDVSADYRVSFPIFNKCFSEYNIGFYVPRTDTCLTCDKIKIQKHLTNEGEAKILIEQHKVHLERAENARQNLRVVKDKAKKDATLLAFTFDMMKTAPIPKMNTSCIFYKRQLWIYNTGIHTLHDGRGYMMVWTEGTGKRGSAEVCSLILQFLKMRDLSHIKNIVTFSDCCGGQNRNKGIMSFFMYACRVFGFDSWQHYYLEPGHSYLPNDSDFGQISKNSKYFSHIYNLADWITVIKTSRKKLPFEAINMEGKFKSIQKLLDDRKFNNCNTNGEKFNFLKLIWFEVDGITDNIKFITSDNTSVRTLLYPRESETLITELEAAPSSYNISSAKYNDLLSLMNLIPAEFQDFYRNLLHD